MLSIKNNIYSIYRIQRLLSLCEHFFHSKQYKEALELFDQKFELCTDVTINMAIKACAISKDYKRGINIYQKLSSNSVNNSYIQALLIQFYSE
ncbi:unnamed protein product [Rotaria sp. Silwood1]|nr:unnamed protein product [Rotaria sp. Silwood1]CAF4826760.1 unnamed protein product [Rotaria sp. Silwood1]